MTRAFTYRRCPPFSHSPSIAAAGVRDKGTGRPRPRLLSVWIGARCRTRTAITTPSTPPPGWQIQAGTHLMSVWHHFVRPRRVNGWSPANTAGSPSRHEQLQCSRAGHPSRRSSFVPHRHVPGVFQSPAGRRSPQRQILTRFGAQSRSGARCFVGGCIIDVNTGPDRRAMVEPEPPRKVPRRPW